MPHLSFAQVCHFWRDCSNGLRYALGPISQQYSNTKDFSPSPCTNNSSCSLFLLWQKIAEPDWFNVRLVSLTLSLTLKQSSSLNAFSYLRRIDPFIFCFTSVARETYRIISLTKINPWQSLTLVNDIIRKRSGVIARKRYAVDDGCCRKRESSN